MKKIAEFILKCMGWTVDPFTPPEKKYVLIVAPHTSAWDFIIGRLAFYTKNLPAVFFIKKEFFFFPFKRLLKRLGGYPIDREHAHNVVEHAAQLLKDSEEMALILTPEGTRKARKIWKKGFYYIASMAEVPLYAGYLDYKRKRCGIVRSIPISGDYEADLKKIKEIYVGVTAKHPEGFVL